MLGDFNQFVSSNFYGEEKEKMIASFSQQQQQQQQQLIHDRNQLDNNSYGLYNNNSISFMVPNIPNSNNYVQLQTPTVANQVYSLGENVYCNQNNLVNDHHLMNQHLNLQLNNQQSNQSKINQLTAIQQKDPKTILNHHLQNVEKINLSASANSRRQQKNNLSASTNLQQRNNGVQQNDLSNLFLNHTRNKGIKRPNSSNSNQQNDKKKITIQFSSDDSSSKVVFENIDISYIYAVVQTIMNQNRIDGLESNECLFPSDYEETILSLLNPDDPIDREILIDNLAMKTKRLYFNKLNQLPFDKKAEMYANIARNKYRKYRDEREVKERQSKEEKVSTKLAPIARPQTYKNFNQRKNYPTDNENVQPKKLKPVPLEEKICFFCRNNGEPEFQYKSHIVRDPITNKTLCPVLRKYVCEICKATGDNSHTRSYCPFGPMMKNKGVDNLQPVKMELVVNVGKEAENNNININNKMPLNLRNELSIKNKENDVTIINKPVDELNDENKENINFENKENINPENNLENDNKMVIFSVKKRQIVRKIDAGVENKEN